jgi:hypothetical protein
MFALITITRIFVLCYLGHLRRNREWWCWCSNKFNGISSKKLWLFFKEIDRTGAGIAHRGVNKDKE